MNVQHAYRNFETSVTSMWNIFSRGMPLERREDRKKKVSGFCRSKRYILDTLMERFFLSLLL